MAAQPTRSQPPGAVQPAAPVHQPIITAEEIMAMAKEQEEEERKAEAEKEAKRQEEQKRLREEARKQRLAALRERQQAEAWTAHKSDDGRVYFYNTLTEQSSWEKPSGYTGPVEVVEGEPEPVSFKPIKGTAWTQVSCKDGRTYYSNSATGATAWCLPDELLEVLADMEEDAAASGVQPLTAETAGILARVAAASGGSTLRPEYKTYLGSGKGATGPSAGPGPVASSGEDAAGAAAAPGVAGRTAAAAGNGAGPSGVQLSKEEAVLKFKELLLDAGVTPFSRFEKEAAKLAKDARWSLVPQRERRLIFDAFCKNVATEQRRLKEERAAASRRSFLDLIALFLAELRADAASQRQRQEHVNADAEMVEAAAADAAAAAADGEAMAASSAHGGRDEMPTAADEKEEGEAPEDEEPGDGGFGSTEREEAAAAVAGRSQESGADEEPAVVAVPADTPEDSGVPADVDLGTMEQRWGDDPRWKACPAALRQELFAELVEPLVQQAQRRRDRLQKHWRSLFTTLLTDQAGMRPGAELPRLERWPELSLSLRGDARFRAVPRQHHRAFFEEHLRKLQALESAKRKEAEERRNSRRELAERAEKHGEEAHRRRMRAQHSEAVAAFRTLLAEVVKDAAAQWRDWRTKLERDPQGRAKSDVLPVQEMESIFREHLSNLKGAIHKRYRQLLTEAIAPLLPQTRRAHDLAMAAAPSAAASSGELPEAAVNWEVALPLLEGDARFQRMPASDRETVWRKFVDDSMGGKEDPGAPAKPEPAVRPAASSGPPVASAPPPNHGVMADDRAPGRDRRGPRPLQAPREEELRQPAAAGSSRHGAAADQLDGEGGGRRHGERARLEREPDQDRGRARDPDRHRPSERSSHHREGPERDRDRDHHRDREREKDRDREHRDRERPRDRDRDWDRGRDRDRDRDKKRARH